MKKNLFYLSMLAVALLTGSCSSDLDEGQTPSANGGQAITFKPWANKTLRAAPTQADDMTEFAVLATDLTAAPAAQVLIDGVVVHGSNATNWSYTPVAHWPEAATVNFYAYSPTAAPGVTNTGTSALAGQNDATAGQPAIEYTLPTTLSDQEDLLVARHSSTYAQDGTSGVTLNFRHVLSRVKFQAKSESATDFKVQSIKLKNIKGKATLDLNKVPKDAGAFAYPGTANPPSAGSPYQTFWVPDGSTVIDLTANLSETDVLGATSGWTDIVDDDDALYVIPQENPASDLPKATPVTGADPSSLFYIEITYIKDDPSATAVTFAVPVPAIAGDANASSLAFEMERQYTFQFELFDNKNIVFKSVTVSDYDDVTQEEPLRLQFAGSNIYYDATAKHLTFDDYGVTANEQFQGVYFKWGSLTGISPVGTYSGTTVTYPKGGEAVISSPAWGSIPSVPPGAPYTTDAKYLTTTAHDTVNGVGDICKYLTQMGWAPAGKRWRMPTAAEFGANTQYTPEPSTGGFGTETAANTDGSDPVSSGYRYKGAFFPASGSRNAAGALDNVGKGGYYWSSSPRSVGFGYFLLFDSAGAHPTSSTNRLDGFPVRCVAE
jgi:hypothetical protein